MSAELLPGHVADARGVCEPLAVGLAVRNLVLGQFVENTHKY